MNKIKRLEVRYAWIEASLRYSGQFDKVSYGRYYAINAPQISADQGDFVRAFNHELSYRERKSGSSSELPYLSIEKGKISILKDLPEEPVFDVPGLREWLRTLTTVSYVEALQFCSVDPDPEIFRQICSLIMREKPSKISFRTGIAEATEFNISPHSILDVDGVLYVRAFDHETACYHDFLIASIVSVAVQDKGIRYRSDEADIDWHEEIDIMIPTLVNRSAGTGTSSLDSMSHVEKEERLVSVPRALSQYLKKNGLQNV